MLDSGLFDTSVPPKLPIWPMEYYWFLYDKKDLSNNKAQGRRPTHPTIPKHQFLTSWEWDSKLNFSYQQQPQVSMLCLHKENMSHSTNYRKLTVPNHRLWSISSCLPLWGRAAGLLPGSAPPWGHLGRNGHSAAPSTTSMRQRGRRWRAPDHRWSPAGTTGSPIHLEAEERGRESDSLNSEHSSASQKRWHRQNWPMGTTGCVYSEY